MAISALATKFLLDVGEDVAKKGAGSLLNGVAATIRSRGLDFWQPNGELRLSMSALLRLRRNDGMFALVRSRHRTEDFSPIGGCFKYHPGDGRNELDKFGFIEEFEILDQDVCCDLRGYTRRRFLRPIKAWFRANSSQRESARECLLRELKEELADEFQILSKRFRWEDLRFRYSHSYETIRKADFGDRLVTQYKYFEIHNPEPGTASDRLIQQLSEYSGNNLIWAGAREIIRGRSAGSNYPIAAPAELLVRPKISKPLSPPPMAQVRLSRTG